ncbi:TBC1 domain family member 20-like isoform X1 [Pelodiscus sinensis]|uniref:TBC1 domain family member 20-like isoform X1 n=1 Tax=Pelodiscus sinensis TaxID=13735 RepID=UPI003F6A9C42
MWPFSPRRSLLEPLSAAGQRVPGSWARHGCDCTPGREPAGFVERLGGQGSQEQAPAGWSPGGAFLPGIAGRLSINIEGHLSVQQRRPGSSPTWSAGKFTPAPGTSERQRVPWRAHSVNPEFRGAAAESPPVPSGGRAAGVEEEAEAAVDPPGPDKRPRGRGDPAGGCGERGGAAHGRDPQEGLAEAAQRQCLQPAPQARQGGPPEPQGLYPGAAGREPLCPPLPPRAGAGGELPASEGMQAEQRQVLQEQLLDLILQVLRARPELHYYQGYHDIAVTLLLVTGQRLGSALLESLSTHHLRDFMDPTMDSTKHILNYLMPLLQRESRPLHDFMLRAEVGTIFALSWLITWYGHVLANFQHVLRLYDFFLASHPLMPVYFAAVLVLHREEEVLACDCDMPSVHQLLSQIPRDLPYERLVGRALQLFQRHPHTELARQAALQGRKSIAIGSFSAFQRAASRQRPDAVLRRERQQEGADGRARVSLPTPGHSPLVKAAVWGLSATLGAAALAVTQTALEWAPEFLLQLF